MNPYKVELLSEQETERFLKMREGLSLFGKPVPEKHCRVLTADGFEIKGQFELIARDAESGEIEWQHSQDNLVTDVGRHNFWTLGFTSNVIGFLPSKETPVPTRMSLSTDGSQSFVSGNLGSGVVTPSTYTKQFSTTFGTPTANRTLGTIYIAYTTPTPHDANLGALSMRAYALLTPPKTQTTTQTLEVVYKISMNPIY
jgi:hypothetical protein